MRFEGVEAAADRLNGLVSTTPVLTNAALDVMTGAQVFLKLESQQITGSFKYRGASNAIAILDEKERRAGVVTYSSGNHAQAVARAAREAGVSALIIMPKDAPLEKVAATEAQGARIIFYDRYTEDRAELALSIAVEEARVLIPPYDDVDVMAGQGTVALELLDQVPDLDALFVPVGGGGLLAGCAVVVDHLRPVIDVFGVEPEAGNDHQQSRRAGERVDIGVPNTIADGQQVSAPGELTWPITNQLTTQFLAVSDEQIRATMSLLLQRAQLMVEPSGACALAAVVHGDLDLIGRRVGVVVSGGNIGWPRFRDLTQ